MTIDKFDYLEPTCPLCGGEEFYYPEKKKKTGNIPVENIIAKLDACLDKEDYEGGERLVNFWIAEAQSLGDTRGELSMQSELMGHFRKMGQAKKALQSVEAGLKILFAEKLENTISGATILVNAATTMKAFGRAKEALPYYEKAREVYEKDLEFGDFRLASLYNNYGLACGELEEKEKATELYNLAIKGLEKTGNNQLEIAISLLNLADLQIFYRIYLALPKS